MATLKLRKIGGVDFGRFLTGLNKAQAKAEARAINLVVRKTKTNTIRGTARRLRQQQKF